MIVDKGLRDGGIASDKKDALAFKAVEQVIQSTDLSVGKIVASYCNQEKQADCKSTIAQDSRIYAELIVEKQLRDQGIASDEKDALAFKAVEQIIQSTDLSIGKIVDSFCRQ